MTSESTHRQRLSKLGLLRDELTGWEGRQAAIYQLEQDLLGLASKPPRLGKPYNVAGSHEQAVFSATFGYLLDMKKKTSNKINDTKRRITVIEAAIEASTRSTK